MPDTSVFSDILSRAIRVEARLAALEKEIRPEQQRAITAANHIIDLPRIRANAPRRRAGDYAAHSGGKVIAFNANKSRRGDRS